MRIQKSFPASRIASCSLFLLGLAIALSGCRREHSRAGFHADFLVGWSPDGSRAAFVPNFLDDDMKDSGVWVYDAGTGRTTNILRTGEKIVCAQPQWSPDGNEFLFSMLDSDEEDSGDKGDGYSYAVWISGPEGQGLRMVAEGTTTGGDAFLAPNAVAWGPVSGTIVFQRVLEDKVVALLMDLHTGDVRPFLPEAADYYTWVPSPDRTGIAALLFEKGSDTARIYIAGFPFENWRLADAFRINDQWIEEFSSLIYWSPDSRRFLVREILKEPEAAADTYLRLFDRMKGSSLRICAADPASAILWNRESTAFIFAAEVEHDEQRIAGIFRVDAATGLMKLIVPDGENHPVSWNHEDGRIYFYRTYSREQHGKSQKEEKEHRLFSCDAEGTRAVMLGHFPAAGCFIWCLSAAGNHAIVFHDSDNPGFANFTTGETRAVPMWQGENR